MGSFSSIITEPSISGARLPFPVRFRIRRLLMGKVNDQSDSQLLRAYADHRSEAAFAELVRRHIDFVHSAACRMVNDPHLAKDVSQGVFTALAKDAGKLASHPVLSGWLHRTARNIAAQTIRTETRRRHREHEATAMNEPSDSDTSWQEISPILDAALGDLNESDRDAVLLRYFENKPAAEMAALLGISAEAAQKRVSRAVDKLRENFARRGITSGAAGVCTVISANAVQAAPAGLAASILSGVTSGTAMITKGIAMTTIQKLLFVTTATLAGVIIYQSRQVSEARDEVARLSKQISMVKTREDRTAESKQDAVRTMHGKSTDAPAAFSVVAYGEGDGAEPSVEGRESPISYISPGGMLSSALIRNFGLSKEQFVSTQRVVSEHWRSMAAWAAESVFRDDAASDADADGANVYRLPAMEATHRRALLDKFAQDLATTSSIEAGNAIMAGLKDDRSFAYMGKYDVVFRFTQLLSQKIEPETLKPLGPPQVIPEDANVSYILFNPNSSNAVLTNAGSDMSDINETFGNIFRLDE